ncbi:MAG: chorismate mutase [Anaerolineae bacterium]|nr:chorismate mutase [Anaerolineae bacterium]
MTSSKDEPHWACRGVRGATTASADTADAILRATRELLDALIRANDMHEADVASIFFTTSPDLTAAYPAAAARQLDWTDVALLSAQEMAPPGSVPRCIRILVHWNTSLPQHAIQHVYMRGAEVLRPDRAQQHPTTPGTNGTARHPHHQAGGVQ